MGSSSGQSIEEYKQVAKEKAGALASGAYTQASNAKNAAMDWFNSMTQNPNGKSPGHNNLD